MPLDALHIRRGPGLIQHSDWPLALITGTGATPKPRLRVDASQTSFWENREFRLYQEFNLAPAATLWLKYNLPCDVVVHGRELTVVEGKARMVFGNFGTVGGVWTPKTIYRVNAMNEAPAYTPQVTAETGGTVTGLVERDAMILETPSSGQATTAQANIAEQGIGVGAFYVGITNTGNANLRGMYKVHWEERASKSSEITGGSVYS